MRLKIVFENGGEEIYDSVVSFNVTEKQSVTKECFTFEVVQKPTEGKLFEVTPLKIDRSLFKESRWI